MDLSFSKINTLLQCPRMFKYRYIDKLVTPTPGRLIQGNAYHRTVARAFYVKLTAGEIMSPKEVTEQAAIFFDKLVSEREVSEEGETRYFEGIDWQGEDPGKLKDETVLYAASYTNQMLNKIMPIEIERRWISDAGDGITLIGYPDMVGRYGEGDIRVFDHKVRGRKMQDQELRNDVQSGIYALIKGEPLNFEFHNIVRGTAGTLRELEIKERAICRDDINWIKDLVKGVSKQIENGIFPPNPSGWICQPRYCSFYEVCRSPINF